MIEATALTKCFGARRRTIRAVDDVSFVCEPGAVFGLLGMNGAGKTTTLRMLATILQPTSGTATVCGFDVATHGADVRRCIGYLSGDTRLYDRLNIREVLEYFGRLHGLNGRVIAERSAELFERFDLHALRNRRVGKLSSGQRQRVNLARALLHAPPVLILDEPSTGLDVMGAREVGRLILDAKREGRCILMSTHAMHEAQKLCDRIAIVHRGRILLEGSRSELIGTDGDLEERFATCVEAAEAAERDIVANESDRMAQGADPVGS